MTLHTPNTPKRRQSQTSSILKMIEGGKQHG